MQDQQPGERAKSAAAEFDAQLEREKREQERRRTVERAMAAIEEAARGASWKSGECETVFEPWRDGDVVQTCVAQRTGRRAPTNPCQGTEFFGAQVLLTLCERVPATWQGRQTLRAQEAKEVLDSARGDPSRPLLSALNEIPRGRERELDSRRLGDWIRHRQGRVESGLRLVRAGDRQGSALWQLVEVGGSGGFGGTSPTLRTESVGLTVSIKRGPTVPPDPRTPRPEGDAGAPPPAGDPEDGGRADLEPDEGEL